MFSGGGGGVESPQGEPQGVGLVVHAVFPSVVQ